MDPRLWEVFELEGLAPKKARVSLTSNDIRKEKVAKKKNKRLAGSGDEWHLISSSKTCLLVTSLEPFTWICHSFEI